MCELDSFPTRRSSDLYLQMTGKPVDELAATAETHLKQAIEADHGDFVAQHMIGAGLLCLGELDQAKQHLELSIRSEEHTSELQSLRHLVCRLLLEKKK